MVNTILVVTVIAAAICGLAFRHITAVRIIAVCVLLATFFASVPIAPHREAEELVHQTPQNAEWQRGAKDTRDAVYRHLPLLIISFLGVVFLAVVPARAKRTI